jgi:hypothetical protein
MKDGQASRREMGLADPQIKIDSKILPSKPALAGRNTQM